MFALENTAEKMKTPKNIPTLYYNTDTEEDMEVEPGDMMEDIHKDKNNMKDKDKIEEEPGDIIEDIYDSDSNDNEYEEMLKRTIEQSKNETILTEEEKTKLGIEESIKELKSIEPVATNATATNLRKLENEQIEAAVKETMANLMSEDASIIAVQELGCAAGASSLSSPATQPGPYQYQHC